MGNQESRPVHMTRTYEDEMASHQKTNDQAEPEAPERTTLLHDRPSLSPPSNRSSSRRSTSQPETPPSRTLVDQRTMNDPSRSPSWSPMSPFATSPDYTGPDDPCREEREENDRLRAQNYDLLDREANLRQRARDWEHEAIDLGGNLIRVRYQRDEARAQLHRAQLNNASLRDAYNTLRQTRRDDRRDARRDASRQRHDADYDRQRLSELVNAANAENDQLRDENERLRGEVAQLRQQIQRGPSVRTVEAVVPSPPPRDIQLVRTVEAAATRPATRNIHSQRPRTNVPRPQRPTRMNTRSQVADRNVRRTPPPSLWQDTRVTKRGAKKGTRKR